MWKGRDSLVEWGSQEGWENHNKSHFRFIFKTPIKGKV